MKYTPRIYARALAESLADAALGAHADIIRRFLESVRKRGDIRRMPEILEAVREINRKRTGGRLVEIAFARRHKKTVLDTFRALFSKHDEVLFRTEPELIAGVRITIDNERELDQTASRRIKKLFR